MATSFFTFFLSFYFTRGAHFLSDFCIKKREGLEFKLCGSFLADLRAYLPCKWRRSILKPARFQAPTELNDTVAVARIEFLYTGGERTGGTTGQESSPKGH